jgi:hypothetical protein
MGKTGTARCLSKPSFQSTMFATRRNRSVPTAKTRQRRSIQDLCPSGRRGWSLSHVRDTMGPLLWRIALVIALNYIALVFAADFIEGPLMRGGIANYPLSYLPFALMLIVATSPGARCSSPGLAAASVMRR